MNPTFYQRVKSYAMDKNVTTHGMTLDEADALLHFLLDLINAHMDTMHYPKTYINRACDLIRYGASITSDVGYKQLGDIYDSVTIAPDEVEYRLTIDPEIQIHKSDRFHMFDHMIYGIGQPRYFDNQIIDTTLRYDQRIHCTECLNKLLTIYNVKNNPKHVDTINQYSAKLSEPKKIDPDNDRKTKKPKPDTR